MLSFISYKFPPSGGSPSLGEHGCRNPEVPQRSFFSFLFSSPLIFCFLLFSPSLWLPLRWRGPSLGSCCHSVAPSFTWWENHPRVGRAWRPVSLERGILVIEGSSTGTLSQCRSWCSQHITLASASGKREVHMGPYASIGWSFICVRLRVKRAVLLSGPCVKGGRRFRGACERIDPG
jgi:hypothetical protein